MAGISWLTGRHLIVRLGVPTGFHIGRIYSGQTGGGKSKVSEFDLAFAINEDVGQFDIPM
jgi:hypothetical protein